MDPAPGTQPSFLCQTLELEEAISCTGCTSELTTTPIYRACKLCTKDDIRTGSKHRDLLAFQSIDSRRSTGKQRREASPFKYLNSNSQNLSVWIALPSEISFCFLSHQQGGRKRTKDITKTACFSSDGNPFQSLRHGGIYLNHEG